MTPDPFSSRPFFFPILNGLLKWASEMSCLPFPFFPFSFLQHCGGHRVPFSPFSAGLFPRYWEPQPDKQHSPTEKESNSQVGTYKRNQYLPPAVISYLIPTRYNEYNASSLAEGEEEG
jgi:hypothetical protein